MKKRTVIKMVSLMLVIFTVLQLLCITAVGTATGNNKTELSIPDGKQAVYFANIKRTNVDKLTFKLGADELFSITSTGMSILSTKVEGKYGAGEYALEIRVNPTQKMVFVFVTLPDGGIIRRGTSTLADFSAISIDTLNAKAVSNVKLTYEDITTDKYELVSSEPISKTFGRNVYNIVTSFSDASSDRLFNFTAQEKFVGSGTMAVKYRAKGAGDWQTVDAARTEEPTGVATEDYYKAEIKGLMAGTEYEYKIGKKESSSSSDWSETYRFTTAKENVDEFTFVAIGDTQGYSWKDHFIYAKAALDVAMSKVKEPAFLIHTGDVVDSGYESYQWNRYFKALGNYGTELANFVAIGNHDTRNAKDVQKNDNLNNYFSFYFNHPEVDKDALAMDAATLSKLSASGKVLVNNFSETVYSYNYGDAHFIVLNSGTYVNTGNETYPDDKHIFEAQRAWLEKDLEANKDARWKIIVIHEAMYHKNGGKQDRTYLTDLIEKSGVDLVIEGHSHLVTRTFPMKDGKIATRSTPDVIEKGIGTVYMTIGSTTPSHSEPGKSVVENMQNIVYQDSTQPAYTTVKINGSELVLTTRQIDGLVLDSFTIKGEEEKVEESSDQITTEAPVPETSEPAGNSKSGCKATVGVAGIAVITILGCGVTALARKRY